MVPPKPSTSTQAFSLTSQLESSIYASHRIRLVGRTVDSKEQGSSGVLTTFIADEFQKIQNLDTPPSLTPCVLALKTTNGSIFGAFLSEAPARKRGYYGNGHCFLWKESTAGSLTAYLTTGQNEHYILSEQGACLALGGGENGFALWIDEGLLHASSNRSKTFGNEPLADESNFEIDGLELWAISI